MGFRKKADEMGDAIIRPLLFTGEAYIQLKNYPVALKFAKEALSYAKENNARPYMMDSYELLAKTYRRLEKNDSAYEYLLKFNSIKDSILNNQFLLRLYNYRRIAEHQREQAQLLLLDKDNKLKTQQLKQEALIRNVLISGLFGLILIAFFILRSLILKRKTEKLKGEQLENEMQVHQLENEKKQSELQHQATELEMQALRAQMNPHFIFNCLSSINKFIIKNESVKASDYLTRFSRLIRMVLINSQKSMIALEDELHMLRLYLDMERLRFKNLFDYRITFTNTIDETAVLVPPLLLQPFCENAVWHGLMQKEGPGHLHIELSMNENILYCNITDDGIGRARAAALRSKSVEKEKSMGLSITTQRLALLNKNQDMQTSFAIDDISDENKNVVGTKVALQIQYKEMKKEIV